uniref:Lipase n=1 Tax=Dendroctonus ponderosae TaxID=77166 RepID=A0AAR5P6G4_DENPD
MLWYSVLMWVFGVVRVFGFHHQNNVCPTLEDYKTIFHNSNCRYNPDVGSSPKFIAKRYGYPLQSHEVVTEDGYILTLHRISGSRNPENSKKKQPVLVFHGLGGSSAFWMLQGKKSLAFFLGDSGYDVWLGNWRGNYYSNRHVTLAEDSAKYWNFGFHEMAIYDLPACIDFVANRTGEKGNLIYVGHSMGTTISYIYSTVKRKHAEDNVKAIISLAPVAYMKNVMGAFRLLAPLAPLVADILRSKGFNAIGQYYKVQRTILVATCGNYPFIDLCNILLIFSSGLSVEQFQAEMIPVFFSYYPSGISLRTLEHFAQIVTSNGRFRMFDYGLRGNLEHYNSTDPPEYDTSQIPVPIHLFVGNNDIIGDVKDASILESRLNKGRSVSTSQIYKFPFAHNDFFLAKQLDGFHKSLLQAIQR